MSALPPKADLDQYVRADVQLPAFAIATSELRYFETVICAVILE